MNPQELSQTRLIDGLPALRLLEGLARVYQLVLVVDQQGRLQWMSSELRRFCGGADCQIGGDARTLFPRLPKPEQLLTIRRLLRSQGYLSHMRVDLRGGDGTEVPAELSVLPISTEDSDPPLLVVIARRVGDRGETAGEQAASVLDNAPDAVLAVDEKGFVTYSNAAVERLLGHSRDELRHRPVALLVHNPIDVEKLASSLGPGQKIRDWDLNLRRSDGSAVAVSASADALKLPDGTVRGTVLFLRDVRERSETELELRKRNQELEHCVHTLAHDLRSPLVAILGFSRLLRQDYGDNLDRTGRRFVDRIEEAGRTMDHMIRDVLELSRIGSDERKSLIDPRIVLLQIQAERKPQLDERGIRLTIPDGPPMVYCDRTRLYQLFSNLIGNAIDHMGPCDAPSISVDIEELPDHHLITVNDSGRGIPAEHQENIFDVFRTLRPHPESRRGSGIGLAIVRKIATTHSGRAWVESEPGHGALFCVTLSRT